MYVDNALDESSLVRNDDDKDFNNNNLTNIKSITLNTQAVNDNQVITKTYVDQFHQENEKLRRDVGLDFYDESNDLVNNYQDNDFNDNKLTNIDSIAVNRNPSSDNEVSNKKYIDDQLDKNTIVRFNQTLESNLKVSVGNDTYNLTKYDKIQFIDTTEIKFPNTGSDLLQKWNINCNKKNIQPRTTDFPTTTKTSSPTGHTRPTKLPPVGTSSMYLETSSNNQGPESVCFI